MLIKLLLLRLRGGFRQRLKELKTLRGVLFLMVTIAVLALFMTQSSLPSNPLESFIPGHPEQLRRQTTQFMPIGLLAAFLLMIFISPTPALYFSPSEINLLFSGPFTRPALLLYKLSFYAFGAFLSSVLIMLLIPSATYTPQAAFLGAFLTMLFIQLLTIAASLLGQLMGTRLASIIQRSALITLAALVAMSAWHSAGKSSGLTDALSQFQASMLGTVILAPFDVFAQIFLAKSFFPDLLAWSMLGLAINAGLILVVIYLDQHACEASVASSLELHKRWDRARRSGLPWGERLLVVHSLIPSPRLAGIGPIAWRQILSAFRESRKILWLYFGLAALAGPLLVVAGAEISRWSLVGGVFFAAVFVLPKTLVFDFRSDLDSMEIFKKLPISPWKISIGQLAAPVILSCLIELVLLMSTALFLDSQLHILLLCIGVCLVPFNILLYGLENLFFLLFPAPLVPVGRADFDFLGRTLVGFVITATILIGSCFFAVSTGQMAAIAMNWPWPAFVTVTLITLSLIAVMTLPLLNWAFNRFDVSRW